MTSHQQIRDFWDWFANHAPEFGDTFQNEALLRQLDVLVAELGNFAWEVGPGEMEENAFVLSPAGNRNLLEVTEAIVAMAPAVPRWEFHPAKPAKHWVPHFQLKDVNDSLIEIDATDWNCVLLEYDDGMREILIHAPSLNGISEDHKQWAIEIAVESLLGERRRLVAIDEVTLVSDFSERERKAAFPMAEIPKRIK